jgi:hypothetical protein
MRLSTVQKHEGQISNFQSPISIFSVIRFFAPLEMTTLDSFRSGTNYSGSEVDRLMMLAW